MIASDDIAWPALRAMAVVDATGAGDVFLAAFVSLPS